ncbi:hypothetical protein C1H46_015747 [Malus baccata]|uniref:Serine-threonine/tyrosine-protein kinase catalytic domain-containing protein n=1 Tax=Malus baccata TaxID=106549 RepID=A0A540MJ86_MALBA|nr:hypothetical protein C1H46_015747 [Malus baccata]
MGSEVTTNGDVYSFGILLLELFTGKRPTNGMFVSTFTTLSRWVCLDSVLVQEIGNLGASTSSATPNQRKNTSATKLKCV